MYYWFFWRSKSFSIFHLKNESRSILKRISFDKIFAFIFDFWRFTSSFFLLYIIDAFSIRNRTRYVNKSDFCKINNTMWNFKHETMNVNFLFKTFFIQFLNTRFSLFATFSNWNCFEIFLIYRNNDLKNFFRFKIFFTIVTIFIFF